MSKQQCIQAYLTLCDVPVRMKYRNCKLKSVYMGILPSLFVEYQ